MQSMTYTIRLSKPSSTSIKRICVTPVCVLENALIYRACFWKNIFGVCNTLPLNKFSNENGGMIISGTSIDSSEVIESIGVSATPNPYALRSTTYVDLVEISTVSSKGLPLRRNPESVTCPKRHTFTPSKELQSPKGLPLI